MSRSLPLLCLLLLGACEGDISVDLSATPPEGVSRAVLRITAVELLRDGGSETVTLNPARDIDTVTLDRGQTVTLLSGEEIPSGSYTGVRLSITAQSQTLDSFLETDAGGEQSLALSAGAQAQASGSFSLRDEESTAITLHLDLRSSLFPGENAAGDRLFSPRLRLVENTGGALSGDVSSALLAEAGCDEDNDPDAGEVVYVFSGTGIVPDDLDNRLPEPLTTALISRDATNADYVVPFLPAGDYTLAVSCVADLDDPGIDDALGFVATETGSVTSGDTRTVSFTQ